MFQGCKTWPLYDFEILQDRSATCTLRLCWQENGPCQACSNFNVCLMLAQPVCNSHIMPCHKDYWYLIVGVTKRHKAGCSDQTSHGMQIHSSLWAKKHSISTFIVSLSADSTYVTSFCTNRFSRECAAPCMAQPHVTAQACRFTRITVKQAISTCFAPLFHSTVYIHTLIPNQNARDKLCCLVHQSLGDSSLACINASKQPSCHTPTVNDRSLTHALTSCRWRLLKKFSFEYRVSTCTNRCAQWCASACLWMHSGLSQHVCRCTVVCLSMSICTWWCHGSLLPQMIVGCIYYLWL